MVAIFKFIVATAFLSQASAVAIEQRQVLQVDEPVLQHRPRTATALVVGDPVLATRTSSIEKRDIVTTSIAATTAVTATASVVSALPTGILMVGEPVLATRIPTSILTKVHIPRATGLPVDIEGVGALGKLVVGEPVLAIRPTTILMKAPTTLATVVKAAQTGIVR